MGNLQQMITQHFILFFFLFWIFYGPLYWVSIPYSHFVWIDTCIKYWNQLQFAMTIGDKLDCSNKFLQPSITGIDSHVVIAPLRQWWVRGEKHLWWWGSSEPVGNFSHANRSGFTVFRSNVCLISSHSKGRLNLAGRVGGSIKIKL